MENLILLTMMSVSIASFANAAPGGGDIGNAQTKTILSCKGTGAGGAMIN